MQMEAKRKPGQQNLYQTKSTLKQTIMRDKEERYIILKRTLEQEYITIVNIYAPNMGAPKYLKQLITNIRDIIVIQ